MGYFTMLCGMALIVPVVKTGNALFFISQEMSATTEQEKLGGMHGD
jgi:hypothetical protein